MSRRTNRTLFVLVTLAATACTSKHTSARRSAALPAGGPKVALFQRSLFPGSTNSGVTPTLEFYAPSITPQTAAAIADSAAVKLGFVVANGAEEVRAVVVARDVTPAPGQTDKQPQPHAVGDFSFAVTPEKPLKDRKWYDVVAEPAIDGVLLVADDTYSLGSGVVTRFYTASAPQLRHLEEVRKDDKAPASLIIRMSEKVSLSDVLSGGLAVVSEGASQKGCVLWNGECLSRGTGDSKVLGFEYRLDGVTPPRFEILLDLSLRGEGGMTVAAGADKSSAVRGGPKQVENRLVYAFDRSTLQQRKERNVFGWSNAE
jgi:hypothetical protein